MASASIGAIGSFWPIGRNCDSALEQVKDSPTRRRSIVAIPGLDDEAAADPDDEVDEPATAAGAGAAILQDDDGTEKLSQ